MHLHVSYFALLLSSHASRHRLTAGRMYRSITMSVAAQPSMKPSAKVAAPLIPNTAIDVAIAVMTAAGADVGSHCTA